MSNDYDSVSDQTTLENEKWRIKMKHTDEESAGESPFLGSAYDGEGEPMRGYEGMQKRHRCDSSDGWQIFSAEIVHFQPQKKTLEISQIRYYITLQPWDFLFCCCTNC